MANNQLSAHEFWLEPIQFSIDVNEKLKANEKVGQNFKGNNYSYLDSSYESLDLTINDDTQKIKSRLGDLPAVNVPVKDDGIAVLSATTTPSFITYETWKKFSNFLNEEGLEWVFEAHKKRKLPERFFVESYRRYTKSLVSVGSGKGSDRVLGLQFEWIIENNPYITDKDSITAQLLWKGKPHVNAHVSVFNRTRNTVIKSHLKTDDQGKVNIPRSNGGRFLINAVHMLEATKELQTEKGAVWDSRWASITYETKPN